MPAATATRAFSRTTRAGCAVASQGGDGASLTDVWSLPVAVGVFGMATAVLLYAGPRLARVVDTLADRSGLAAEATSSDVFAVGWTMLLPAFLGAGMIRRQRDRIGFEGFGILAAYFAGPASSH
jgi:hypothetical protein